MPSARTIVSYRPTPEEQGLLEALSRKMGMSKSRTLAFALRRIAEEEKVVPAPVQPTPEERARIQTLYDELTPAYWKRWGELQTRQREGIVTDAEREELFTLIERGEDWNVRRLTYLFELAKSYGLPHDYFLDSLNLRHHPLAPRAS